MLPQGFHRQLLWGGRHLLPAGVSLRKQLLRRCGLLRLGASGRSGSQRGMTVVNGRQVHGLTSALSSGLSRRQTLTVLGAMVSGSGLFAVPSDDAAALTELNVSGAVLGSKPQRPDTGHAACPAAPLVLGMETRASRGG
jgi:hypothetical protein